MGNFCCGETNINKKLSNPNLSYQNSNNVSQAPSIQRSPTSTSIISTKSANAIIQSNTQKKNTLEIRPIKQVSIQEGVDFLTKEALVSPNDLDNQFHCIYTSDTQKLIGPTNYQRYFIPPIGWTAIALKVAKIYDLGNDNWLNKEWYIGYHGVKNIISINNIIYKGFKKGPRHSYKNADNVNPLTNKLFPKCGEGVYFAQNINDAESYTEIIPYSGNNYRVVFMCRLNPMAVRIAKRDSNNDYMIVNGDNIDDMFGTAKINEVRPYKILLIKE